MLFVSAAADSAAPRPQVSSIKVLCDYVDHIMAEYFSTPAPTLPEEAPAGGESPWSEAGQVGGPAWLALNRWVEHVRPRSKQPDHCVYACAEASHSCATCCMRACAGVPMVSVSCALAGLVRCCSWHACAGQPAEHGAEHTCPAVHNMWPPC
jgi:hypothetical protein